jgi:hypothetical protein
MKWSLAVIGLLIGLAIGFGTGLIAGMVKGEFDTKVRIYTVQRERIEPVLVANPDYADIEVNMASAGHAYLTGRVSSEQVRGQLRGEMAHLFGDEFAVTLVNGVVVKGN